MNAADHAEILSLTDSRLVIADLFHALNQPLTMLNCSLELALRQPGMPEPCHEYLQQALEHISRVTEITGSIRQMIEAGDPGDTTPVQDLFLILQEVIADLGPLAEQKRTSLALQGEVGAAVKFEPHRLRQALFLLVEFAVDSSEPGALIEVVVARGDGRSSLSVAVSASGVHASNAEVAARGNTEFLALAIARRTFEAAGGCFRVDDERSLHIEVHFANATSAGRTPSL